MAAQEVIIDFVVNDDSLNTAIQTLEKMGKVDSSVAQSFKATNQEINKQADAIKNTAAAYKGPIQSIEQLDKKSKQFVKDFIDGFQEGITAELKRAKPEIDAFKKKLEGIGAVKKDLAEAKKELELLRNTLRTSGAQSDAFAKEIEELKKQLDASGTQTEELVKQVEALKNKLKETGKEATPPIQSLKQELRLLTEQIAKTKAEGGPVDAAMLQRAGQLKDAISDANAEIKNMGSDTRQIDNVVGSISALAGGFSAVQGAIGLFSEDSEELQKVLLKVNSAMALATGIQQFYNATLKEGSLTKLADSAATGIQVAVQRIYTFVTGQATAATLAFKVALAATGIGLIVVAILALNQALKGTKDDMEAATEAIDSQNRALESANALIQRNLDIEIARAELLEKSESDLTRIRGKALQAQFENLQAFNKIMAAQRDQVDKTSEAWFLLNEQIEKNNDTMKKLSTDIVVTGINLERQLAEERKQAEEKRKEAEEKRLADAKAANERALRLARELRAAEFADFKAGVELQLLAAEKGSEEELSLRKKFLNAELLIDLENEKLTINQRKLLIKQFFVDRLQLEKDFNKAREAQTLSDIGSDLNAELQQINLTNERRLELTESALQIQAALEVEAAEGNAAKITEINAKRDKAIFEARKAAIIQSAEFEASFSEATGGVAKRALQRVAEDEKQKLDVRINAIDQLEKLEITSIDKRGETNKTLFKKGLITQQEFQLREAQLLDEKNKVWEDSENERAGIVEKTNEFIKASTIQTVQDTLQVLTEVTSTLDAIFSVQAAAENQQLDEQKRKLKELQDIGAITEKEAIQRQRRIETEERKIKQQQAEREKKVQVFNALLAIPAAFLQGLSTGGPYVGAIYAALAAIQAAAIAARPVPRFAKGKKDRYEGPGIMGEAGAELIQRADGSMHIATKPTLVYVGTKDKIFTHTETKNMMIPHVDKSAMRIKEPEDKMDYDKLAKAILRNFKPTPGTSINIDKEFISESLVDGLMKTNYFDRYYKSK